MNYSEFYSELGKLLYAVADIDKVITRKEKEKLLEIVTTELVPVEEHTDRFGTDAAHYSEIEFDFLDEQVADAQSAFESFIDFVEEHRTAINGKLMNVCLTVSKELAAAYRGTTRKEKNLIEKLRKGLEHIRAENEAIPSVRKQ
jgi:hypothetical protein